MYLRKENWKKIRYLGTGGKIIEEKNIGCKKALNGGGGGERNGRKFN